MNSKYCSFRLKIFIRIHLISFPNQNDNSNVIIYEMTKNFSFPSMKGIRKHFVLEEMSVFVVLIDLYCLMVI